LATTAFEYVDVYWIENEPEGRRRLVRPLLEILEMEEVGDRDLQGERKGRGGSRGGRLVRFEKQRKRRRCRGKGCSKRKVRGVPRPDDRSILKRSIELGDVGFLDGAIALLEPLASRIDWSHNVPLALETLYYLALFRARRGDLQWAVDQAEEGLVFAWKLGTRKDLEAFDCLLRAVEDGEAQSLQPRDSEGWGREPGRLCWSDHELPFP
jgi:hypothetical protein